MDLLPRQHQPERGVVFLRWTLSSVILYCFWWWPASLLSGVGSVGEKVVFDSNCLRSSLPVVSLVCDADAVHKPACMQAASQRQQRFCAHNAAELLFTHMPGTSHATWV